MNKRIVTIALFLAIVFTGKAQVEPFLLNAKPEDKETREVWVDSVYNTLSIKERIGQMFVFTIAPHQNKPTTNLLKRVVQDYGVGGLLFSGGEVINQVRLTNQAQEWAKVPLMVTFDGEWGLSMRLKETPKYPRNMVLGAITSDPLLYAYGKEVGRQLREIGVHVNFAPVGDVNINPKNPVINTRSFGEDPKLVSQKVIAYSKGLESQNVLSVTKHFPGHGDTNVDSHKSLPKLNFTRARLDSIEFYPFTALTQANLSGVMVGHLEVPSLEPTPGLPSSLSHNIVQKILIDSIGFNGLVFTDALAMRGAAVGNGICLKAIQAGNDMVLTPPQIKRELDLVYAAFKSGELSEQLIEERCKKILRYKHALNIHKQQAIQLSGLTQRINTTEAHQLIKQLELAATTVVKNENSCLPFHRQVKRVALIHSDNSSTYSALIEELSAHCNVDVIALDPSLSVASRQALIKRIADADRIVVALSGRNLQAYNTYFTPLEAKAPLSYLFFTGGQYLSNMERAISKSDVTILAHSLDSHIQKGVADVLLGKRKAEGRLAVGIGTSYPAGSGVTTALAEEAKYLASDFGLDVTKLSEIDSIVKQSIVDKAFPGCQIAIMKDGHLVYDNAFGSVVGGDSDKVTTDHLYDLASLSKTTGTLLGVMKLYDTGRLSLTDRISTYLPELKNTDKRNITVQDLLFHESGMPAGLYVYSEIVDPNSHRGALIRVNRTNLHTVRLGNRSWANPCFKFQEGLASSIKTDTHRLQIADGLWFDPMISSRILSRIIERPLQNRRYRYSCLGFILLQQVVERISGESLDVFLDKEFFTPMELSTIKYNPLKYFDKKDIVPSNEDRFFRKTRLQGFVHDETAVLLGGVSGNAGQFSNAKTVAKIYQMILDGGTYRGERYLGESTCDLFKTTKSKLSRRGLGYDKPNPIKSQSSPCSESTPLETFGHTGFTGTGAWADPVNNIVYVFISNRIYPSIWPNKLSSDDIRERIQEVIYTSLK